jgi:iron complex outermembrane receptor protein
MGNAVRATHRGALFAAVATTTLASAFAGHAATAATPSAGPAPADQVTEVVVTAQKRSQSVQAIPAAISAISGVNLDQRGIKTVNDLQFAVPSFHSGTLTGSTGITIRGVGATSVGTSGTAGVAVNVDGVYQTQTSTVDMAQIDLQRVEVLRGPQGTLYGRNATGGAVNFITNAPTSQFGGSLLAGYATYDEYHLQGILNVPLGDHVRTRLLVDYRDREDGFVKNINPGGEDLDKGKTLSSRFRLSADLTSKLDFDLGVAVVHSTGPWQYLTNYSAPSAGSLLINPFLANAKFISTPWRTDANDPVGGTRDYQSVSGTFTWRLPFGELKSITAYQNYLYNYQNDGDGTNLSVAPYTGKTSDRAVTQEFDLNGHWDRLDWVVGAFYLNENNFNRLFYNFSLGLSGLPPSSYLDFEQPRYNTTSYAGFADGTFHVTDSLKLIGGVRYSEDIQKATYGNFFGLLVAGQKVPVAPFCPYETDNLKSSSFTPRAGLQYDINPRMNVYFTYSRGFKAGGANIYSCEDDYSPETITSYEGGLKSRWFDNTLTFNLSAFHYDYANFQVSQIVGLSLNVTNAAAAKIDGVEVEAAWTPDSHWSINGNFAYINAVYANFSNVDGLNPGLGLQNLKGNLLNNSPRESGAVGIAYRTNPYSFGRLTGRLDTSYSSRVFFREFNAPLDSQAPYGLVNLNLIWESPNQKYMARLYATNLTNQAYAAAQGDSTSIGTRYITWGAPRQVGGEFRVSF